MKKEMFWHTLTEITWSPGAQEATVVGKLRAKLWCLGLRAQG